jgi:hypothetical protein
MEQLAAAYVTSALYQQQMHDVQQSQLQQGQHYGVSHHQHQQQHLQQQQQHQQHQRRVGGVGSGADAAANRFGRGEFDAMPGFDASSSSSAFASSSSALASSSSSASHRRAQQHRMLHSLALGSGIPLSECRMKRVPFFKQLQSLMGLFCRELV